MKRIAINTKALVIVAIGVLVLAVGGLTFTTFASEEYIVNSNINAMMDDIDKEILKASDLSYSSNPYDYIVDNSHFANIVDEGITAVPVLLDELESSAQNGLREYLMAIAVEDITNIHLKDFANTRIIGTADTYRWGNAKDFLDKWDTYLRNVSTEVDSIVSDTEDTLESKEAELKEIGTMALPIIQKAVENGHEEFQPVYDELLTVRVNDSARTLTDTDMQILTEILDSAKS